MKFAALLLLSLPAFAQPSELIAAGGHYNSYAAPQFGGVLVYAHRVGGTVEPTYSFTCLQVISVTRVPFRVGTLTETGVAQHIKQIGPVSVYGVAMAGTVVSSTESGTSVGFAGSGGGLATIPLGKGWFLGPYVMWNRPSAGIGSQTSVGLMVAWGK